MKSTPHISLLVAAALCSTAVAKTPAKPAAHECPSKCASTGHTDIAPVRKRSGNSVEIVSARAVAVGDRMRVYGRLKRSHLAKPAPGAHVDVRLIAANGKVMAEATDRYASVFLTAHSRLGLRREVSFRTDLPLPPPGSYVEIVHHNAAESTCSLAGGS